MYFRATKDPRISRQSAHEGDKFVSAMYWPPLPPGDIPATHYCYEVELIPEP